MAASIERRNARHLKAIRALSSAIAHDINNLLSGVFGYGELLLLELSSRELKIPVEEIKRAGKRISSLTQLLSAFSGKFSSRPESLDIFEVLQEIKGFLAGMLGKSIEFSLEQTSGIWLLKADAGILKLALITMAIEIRSLMPEGGSLCVSARNLPEDAAAYRKTNLEPGRYVVVSAIAAGRIAVEEVGLSLLDADAPSDNKGAETDCAIPSILDLAQLSDGLSTIDDLSQHELRVSLYFPATLRESQPEGAG